MKQEFKIELDGKEKFILAEVIDQKLWFKVENEIYSFDLIDLLQSSYGRSQAKAKSPEKITAPMPGKITKIFVSKGQSVKKGETLIVMEAMKMEYTLKSDIDGKVENINAAVNQQVTLGALLVQLAELKR